MFPEELCKALSKLHSNAPTHKPAHTRHLVERAFGNRRLEDVFEWFDIKPLASGSIAQVRASSSLFGVFLVSLNEIVKLDNF